MVRAIASLSLFLLAVSAAERPYIAVIEKVAGAVEFFDSNARSLGRVKVGSFPHEAALSKDGKLLYVSDNGVLWMTEDTLGTNSISIVDVEAMKRVGVIDLGRFHRPHGISFIPGTERLLATTERPFGLVMVDAAARKLVRDYDVGGKSPHMVMPSRDGRWAFVSNTDSDNVAVINLETGSTKLIPTAAHPQGGVFSPNGNQLFVANTNGNKISIIDVQKQSVVGEIDTGKGPARIAITPDGNTLIYNLQFEPAVGFADVATHKQTGTVPLSGRPLSLTLTRDARRAFAGIQDQDKVVFLSVKDRKIERVLQLSKDSGPDPVIPLGDN